MERPIDVIRGGLAEVWDARGRRFVTFEVVRRGRADPDLWVQWIDGELNVSWPRDDDPAVALARLGVPLPRGGFCSWHAPGSNAIFEVGDALLDDVARFVDRLFSGVLAGSDRYEVAARVEDDR